MHNAYLLSPAARGGTTTQWPNGGTVYSEDFAWFAVTCFQSINGDLGGTWTPSSQIVIGGSGLSVTGPVHTGASTTIGNVNTDTLTINAFGTFVNGWQSNGTSAFHKDVTFDAGTFGSATVVSDSHVAWTINGTFTVATTAQLNGGAAISGNTVIGGAATAFTIGLLVVTTFNGTVKCSGGGAITSRRHYVGDASYTMTASSLFEFLEFNTSSGGRIVHYRHRPQYPTGSAFTCETPTLLRTCSLLMPIRRTTDTLADQPITTGYCFSLMSPGVRGTLSLAASTLPT